MDGRDMASIRLYLWAICAVVRPNLASRPIQELGGLQRERCWWPFQQPAKFVHVTSLATLG